MSIAKDITYISIFFWLLPPFRQYRGSFFYFFLLIAISDPLALLFVDVIGLNPDILHVFLGVMLFYSIDIKSLDFKENKFFHITFISGIIVLVVIISNLSIILFLLHLSILSKLIKLLISKVYKDQELNIFYFVIVFYELSVVLNLLVYFSASEVWMFIFYTTLTFQILSAIFFTIFTEKSDFLILKLKSPD